MSTSYQIFYDAFFDKIEKDDRFFDYFNLTPEESLELAKYRAKTYLKESISRLTLACKPDVDFNDFNDTTEEINVDVTNAEVDLISNFMFEMFLFRDIAKLRVMSLNFTPTDLRVFSPSESRKTFMEMYNFVVTQNISLISSYSNRDRLTGVLKGINYDSYNSDE